MNTNPKKHILLAAAVLGVQFLTACMSGQGMSDSGADGGGTRGGKLGSMARFQVVGDRLYALSGSAVQVYGVSDPKAIAFQNSLTLDAGIETLFAKGDNLYVGSATGMIIVDIADRDNPQRAGTVTHFRSCDPVVVQGNLAYVTLRGGNRCWTAANELQILDVTDMYHPIKLKSYPMANPYGVGVDGDKLFLCDGYAGLKVYRVNPDKSIVLIERVDGIETYDVIPATGNGKHLILIAKDGLYQFDYGQSPMKQLSHIKIGT